VTGFGGSSTPGEGAGGGNSDKAPVTQVMDSIMGMALQLPALKTIGESIGVDLSSAVNSSKPSESAPTETKDAQDKKK
jgi:4-diphosphocytidyl-2C-methyl-D-erythritol kinase